METAVAMKRCEEPRSFIVKTENGKTFSRDHQHLCQIADSNGTDDIILISDGEENSIEQVIVKHDEVEMNLHDEVYIHHLDNLSNEAATRPGRVSRIPIQYNDYLQQNEH